MLKFARHKSAFVCNLKRSNPPTRLRSIKTQTTSLSLQIRENLSLKCVICLIYISQYSYEWCV